MTPTSKNLVRRLNEQNVLQHVFNNSPISRAQVSKDLKLNKVTVSQVVMTLIDQHFITEVGEAESSRRGGRKPVMLRFNAQLGYTVAFDVGVEYVDMMVNYLDGRIAHFKRFEALGLSIMERLDLMNTQLTQQIGFPETERGLVGIAVAVHAVIFNGQVLDSPFVKMAPSTVLDYFTARVNVPVVIENEANLAAVCQRDFANTTVSNQITISIHKGIGAGIIINGKLYRGMDGRAGEIGRSLVFDAKQNEYCKIESLCSEDAIIDQVRTVKGNAALDRRSVLSLYDAKDPDVLEIMERFCRLTAVLMHNVANAYAPTEIILNSAMIATRPALFTMIKEEFSGMRDNVGTIKLAYDVDHAVLLGGCSLCVHQALDLGALTLRLSAS